jgi:cation transport ATPase
LNGEEKKTTDEKKNEYLEEVLFAMKLRKYTVSKNTQKECRDLLSKRKPGFMEWVLDNPVALRVVVVIGVIVPFLLLLALFLFSVKKASTQPWFWAGAVLAAVLTFYSYKRVEMVYKLIFTTERVSINSLVYGKRRQGGE